MMDEYDGLGDGDGDGGNDRLYGSIRDPHILGTLIGRTVIDITENDPEEFDRYIMLMFDNGSALRVPTTKDGLDYINVPGED